MLRRVTTALILGAYLGLPLANPQKALTIAELDHVLITEIKLGGDSSPNKEFVEIFNDGDTPVDIEGWTLEYAKTSFSSENCNSYSWKTKAATVSQVNAETLSGSLDPAEFLVIDISLNDGISGSVHLVSGAADAFVVHDQVGWGEDSPCFAGDNPAQVPLKNNSITRTFDANGHPINSVDNGADFSLTESPSPGTDRCLEIDCYEVEQEPETPGESESTPEEPQQYYNLVITELLPDPASPKLDSADEFVELYNPQPFEVNLKDYVLYTGSTTSTYKYLLPDVSLQSGEYRAFYSVDSKLALVNSTGYAWLTAPDGVLLSETNWYTEIGTEKSWALIDNQWQVTNVLTPSAANVAVVDNVLGGVQEEDSVLAACPEGKYRNPSTNRCKNIEDEETSLVACKPEQERNPETNRCRSVLAASKTLTPCKVGQERNPLTNRCRNIAGINVELKDCQEGYERNSETNRCRKTQATLAKTQVKPDSNSEFISGLNYGVLGLVSFAAVGYGGYEYRHDFLNTWQKLRKRFIKTS